MTAGYFFKMIFLAILFLLKGFVEVKSQIVVKMEEENGVYTLPCSVNGLNLRFILDTGAGDVSISLAEASFMLKHGYLKPEDIIGRTNVQIADGSIMENTKIILKIIEIGGIKLSDVEASVVHNLKAPLLLGQSVLQQLGKYEINNDNLIIYGNSSSDFPIDKGPINHVAMKDVRKSGKIFFLEVAEKLDKARYYYKEKNYELATKYYVDILENHEDISEEIFKASDYYSLGESLYFTKDYKAAFLFLSLFDIERDYEINFGDSLLYYYRMANCTNELEIYEASLGFCNKCIEISERNNVKVVPMIYFIMGNSYYFLKEYDNSMKMYTQSARSHVDRLSKDKKKLFDKGKFFEDEILGFHWYKIGICYKAMGAYTDAKRYLKAAYAFGFESAMIVYDEMN